MLLYLEETFVIRFIPEGVIKCALWGNQVCHFEILMNTWKPDVKGLTSREFLEEQLEEFNNWRYGPSPPPLRWLW
jgi:hypothetical protein